MLKKSLICFIKVILAECSKTHFIIAPLSVSMVAECDFFQKCPISGVKLTILARMKDIPKWSADHYWPCCTWFLLRKSHWHVFRPTPKHFYDVEMFCDFFLFVEPFARLFYLPYHHFCLSKTPNSITFLLLVVIRLYFLYWLLLLANCKRWCWKQSF